MNQPDPTAEFDSCNRKCRKTGAHTRVWGECEFGIQPEPTCMCGHPMRQHHEDVCLTECGCNDGREPAAAGDLPDRLEAALTARFTELGNPFARMRIAFQGPDGWPASKEVGPHDVALVLRELLAAGPAVVSPPTERADLRDRIRRAVCEAEGFAWDSDMLEPDEYGEHADAVLAVLPEPVDQAALRDHIAADVLRVAEAALGDTLLPAAREQALAGIAAVLPEPADRAAIDTASDATQHACGNCEGTDPCTCLTRPDLNVRPLPADALVADEVFVGQQAAVAEAHRLALSEALGLGTSAPWDAIRERAAELAGDTTAPTLSGRIARLVARDASALRMDLYEDLAAFARETSVPGLQHAQIRDHLAEFLFERLLRRLAGEQPTQDEARPMLRSSSTVRPGTATVASDMCPRCKGDNTEAFELCDRCASETAAQDKAPVVTVHACPQLGDNGISRCCGRPPCEFVGERVTRDPDKVTCRG